MGFMDKIKGLVKGREKQVKGGIDTVSNKVEQSVGPKHASKVDDLSDKAKDAVDKLSKGDAATTTPAAPVSPAPPVVPPTAERDAPPSP